MKDIDKILDPTEKESLEREMDELLAYDCSYDEMEQLFLDFGLEMDYFMDMIF